jgi:hypothetical protein
MRIQHPRRERQTTHGRWWWLVEWEQESSIFSPKYRAWWMSWIRMIWRGTICWWIITPIHTPVKVRELVESRGYKCMYLHRISLSWIILEEFWSKVKVGVRRNALTADDQLSDHVCEVIRTVIQTDCQALDSPCAIILFKVQAKDTKLWEEMMVDTMDEIRTGTS